MSTLSVLYTSEDRGELPPLLLQNKEGVSASSVNQRLRIALSALVFLLSLRVCGLPEAFITLTGKTGYLVRDDSMITVRVARHIAEGMGPYFNRGEHIAASTSLIWPYLMSPVFWVVHDPGRCVLILALLSGLIVAITVAGITFAADSTLAACGVAATLLAMPALPYYGPSVWEQVPQMLLVTAAFLALLGRIPVLARRRVEWALIFAAMSFLLRPDTLPMVFVLGMWVAVTARSRGGWMSYVALSVTAIAVGGYFALHHHFYGDFVPNTYYLKVHLGPGSVLKGLRYMAVTAADTGVPFLLLAGFIVPVRRAASVAEQRLLMVSVAVQCVYVVLIGGDIFHYGRFLLMFAPIGALLFWEGVSDLLSGLTASSPGKWALVGLGLTSLFTASFANMVRDHQIATRTLLSTGMSAGADDYSDQAILADCLRSHLSPADGDIGIFTLGSLPYYLDEYSFADFLGKADAVVAHGPAHWGPTGHNKWDIRHTLQDRHVSVVPFEMLPDELAQKMVRNHMPATVPAVLQLDPYMLANYTYRSPVQLKLPGPYGLLVRNDLVRKFAAPCVNGSVSTD